MSFQVGIGSLGGTVFFQVGLCTPQEIFTCLKSTIEIPERNVKYVQSYC